MNDHATPPHLRALPPLPADAPSEDETAVLRCRGTADFLAALPFVTGFTATNSLFTVLFHGRRAGNVIRIDLPENQRRETVEALLDALTGILRETGAGAGSPALVIVTDQSFGADGSAPWARFARRLRRRFREEGWRPRELAVVAQNGWAGLLGDAPVVPRPLSEIAESPVARATESMRLAPRELSALSILPERDPERAAAVEQRLGELEQRRRARSAHPASNGGQAESSVWMHGTARVAGACFEAAEAGARHPDPRLLARLIEAAQQPHHWLVVALTALTRVEFVSGLAEQSPAGRFAAVPIDIDEHSGDSSGGGWSIRHVLLSLAHETPDPKKLQRAVSTFADAAAHAPLAQRPGLLALLAWAWWMLGLQSVCHNHLQQSLAIDGDHELSRMVERLNQHPPAARLIELQQRFAA